MSRVLALDEDALHLELLTCLLKQEGHHVYATRDFDRALELIRSDVVDLVVIEIALHRQDGFRVCEQIRTMKPDLPLMILSVRTEEEYIIRGLLVAADDYMTKPFSPRQFLARVHALLRRGNRSQVSRWLEEPPICGELVLNLHQMHVEVNGKQVLLTPRELSLLHALMMNRGRVLNRDQLIQIAWGHHFAGTARTVDVYVERLRKKIQPHMTEAFYIRAVRGFGYSLTPPQSRAALKPAPGGEYRSLVTRPEPQLIGSAGSINKL